MTEKKMVALQKREDRLLSKMRDKDIADGKRKMLNRYMLDAMQIEAKRWPKLNELEKSLETNLLLP